MRVNVYAEEMPETPRVEIISKTVEGNAFTGLRIYLELPATVDGNQYQGPFIHRFNDDDSAAVTFWGKRDLRETLLAAIEQLDAHYYALGKRALGDPLRRCDISCHCPAESAIRRAVLAVEKMPADTRLSQAVGLLDQAQRCVADFVDDQK
jgi:hypothetical protein